MHDGAGLSDATNPNGLVSNIIFENIDYDLLTIGPIPFPSKLIGYLTGSGNHELIDTDIAYETANGFSKVYGERYLTSNVQIMNKATKKYEYIGQRYRYFTTRHGMFSSTFVALRSLIPSRFTNHGLWSHFRFQGGQCRQNYHRRCLDEGRLVSECRHERAH